MSHVFDDDVIDKTTRGGAWFTGYRLLAAAYPVALRDLTPSHMSELHGRLREGGWSPTANANPSRITDQPRRIEVVRATLSVAIGTADL
ncbi:hypothetical protein BD410DRAFT_844179 [Rickenella mellea]|uniref:Uncharacterized protein n=1 Tax=Rickenella mellea TaxID=50990 RepID=A0A4Y7PNP9_9AGAM|nr:hypothetical protein BD410DRAFT_844179 [Rickenella mellea]